MEKTVQRMSGTEQLAQTLNIFGVRHLSPASAHHVLAYLERIRPKLILLEGPSDANEWLVHIASEKVKPPIALLGYTTDSPVQTVMYPFASYSPEYQAIRWAHRNACEVRFCDLPISAIIGPRDENASDYAKIPSLFYTKTAELAGEPDYESFWERHFEHCADTDSFIEKINTLSQTMRDYLDRDDAHNALRESFMKRHYCEAIQEGFAPEEMVVITGAYHVDGIKKTLPLSDEGRNGLPQTPVKMTLMPYSYYRLSAQSGYGAGNKAPAYFQLMWDCLQARDVEKLPALYLSALSETTRKSGNFTSTANVIEAVRLSGMLAAMHEGKHPTLKDLHDSAVCLLGAGELAALSESFARVDVGTAIGALPEGISQTPVQDDMQRQLKRLKLEKYKSSVAQDLRLDLRENRQVKTKEAAFIDMHRSIFFHRLLLLNISFVRFVEQYDASAWSESWVLQWTPETEIEIVEATLKGETLENAAAFVLKEQLEAATGILEVAQLIRKAFVCSLLAEVPNAVARLQTLCVDGSDFTEAAFTAWEISNTIKYRDVREIDTALLIPILQQVFLRAALILFEGAACDDEASKEFISAMDKMHQVSQEQYESIHDALWLAKLKELADSDTRNAKISGVAMAILMERNEISDAKLQTEVSKRLSYGVPGDLAASWFEGLSNRNRYVLLSRITLWAQLNDYIQSLDNDEFKRALVFLRRAFADFDPREKNSIVEILGDLWNIDQGHLGEYLQESLSDDEQEQLMAINDFDFDDL